MGDENVKLIVSADTTAVTRAMRSGSQAVSDFASKAKASMTGSMQDMGKSMLGGLMAGFSIGVIKSKLTELGEMAKGIRLEAEKTGMSIEGVQGFRRGAKKALLDPETADKALDHLATSIGKARTGGGSEDRAESRKQHSLNALTGREWDPDKINTSAEAFKKWGIALSDSNGKARGTEDILGDVADLISKTGDATKRAAIAAEFFGEKMGAKLVPVLSHGRKGLEEMKHGMGIFTKEDLSALEEAAEGVIKLGKAVEWLGAKILIPFTKLGAGIGAMLGHLSTGDIKGAWKVFKDGPEKDPDKSKDDSEDKAAAVQKHADAQKRLQEALEKVALDRAVGAERIKMLEDKRADTLLHLYATEDKFGANSTEAIDERTRAALEIGQIDKEIKASKEALQNKTFGRKKEQSSINDKTIELEITQQLKEAESELSIMEARRDSFKVGSAAYSKAELEARQQALAVDQIKLDLEHEAVTAAKEKLSIIDKELLQENTIERTEELKIERAAAELALKQAGLKVTEHAIDLETQRGRLAGSLAKQESDLQTAKEDRNNYTLQELAGMRIDRSRKHGLHRRDLNPLADDIRAAREAQLHESQADYFKSIGDQQGADYQRNWADEIKSNIQSLKETERNPFKTMAEGIERTADNLDTVVAEGLKFKNGK